MKNLTNKLFLICLCITTITCCKNSCFAQENPQKTKKIGIILPIEHQALNEIAQSFQDNLQQLYKQPIKFKISNAQGDINLQRAIITQMTNAKYDLIVPISTTVTQMAVSMETTKPIIGLATDIKDKKNNLVTVNDEIDKTKSIAFIHKAYPQLKKITLIHSTSNKIFAEIKQTEKACKQYNISTHRLMIQNLAELYSTAQAIPSDIQAIFILKDNLLASGIETLIQLAKNRKLLLITSDEVTIQKGADFALGVKEKDIGVAGARLAIQILQGITPNKLQTITLTEPTLFINSQALTYKNQNLKTIILAAKQFGYPITNINNTKK